MAEKLLTVEVRIDDQNRYNSRKIGIKFFEYNTIKRHEYTDTDLGHFPIIPDIPSI